MHHSYFLEEVKRYMESEGAEVGIHASESLLPADDFDDGKIEGKHGAKQNLSLGRRLGRGHALSEEEIRAIKAFYQQNHNNYPTITELWERFAELVSTVPPGLNTPFHCAVELIACLSILPEPRQPG